MPLHATALERAARRPAARNRVASGLLRHAAEDVIGVGADRGAREEPDQVPDHPSARVADAAAVLRSDPSWDAARSWLRGSPRPAAQRRGATTNPGREVRDAHLAGSMGEMGRTTSDVGGGLRRRCCRGPPGEDHRHATLCGLFRRTSLAKGEVCNASPTDRPNPGSRRRSGRSSSTRCTSTRTSSAIARPAPAVGRRMGPRAYAHAALANRMIVKRALLREARGAY